MLAGFFSSITTKDKKGGVGDADAAASFAEDWLCCNWACGRADVRAVDLGQFDKQTVPIDYPITVLQ